MHYSEIYADERARDMEAAAQRRMGCCPLGRMISRVIMNCDGREGRMRNERMDYAKAYPHAQTCYVRPTARTVTVSTTNHHHANAHAIPPERAQTHTTLPGTTFAAAAPPARAGAKPRKKKKSKRVRFAPAEPAAPARFTPAGPVPFGPAPPPHGTHAQQHAEAGTSSAEASGHHYHDHPGGAEPYSPAVHGPGPGYRYGRYAPSPLTRWEMLGTAETPRRYEYFSGEYRWCYPTPVREGIYYIATDANRLTTIFSEENPNACTIV